MPHVNPAPLTVLYNNTTPGVAASPDAVDGAIEAIVDAVNINFDTAQDTNANFSTHKNNNVLDHPDQSVTSAKIKDENVTTPKIANAGVTTPKIAPRNVTRDRIAIGGVGYQELDPTLTELIPNVAIQAKFQSLDAQLAEIAANPLMYGAVGNGVADDGPALRAAVAYLQSKGGGTLLVPAGLVFAASLSDFGSGRKGVIRLSSNITVQMTGATIKLLPTNEESYDIIGMYNSSNCHVVGGTLIGNKYNSAATTGEHGIGIGLYGCSSCTIDGSLVKECWGDGIYIGRVFSVVTCCTNIKVSNVICDDNRRQGMSIISCRNLLVENLIATNTSGTSPSDGIDIEPNFPDEYLENIQLRSIYTSNNAGSGIKFYLSQLDSTSAIVSVRIDDHTDRSSTGDSSFRVRRIKKRTRGTIIARGCTWENTGARVVSHDENVSNGISTILEDCSFGYNGTNLAFPVIDGRANRSGGAVSPDPGDLETSTVGNLQVVRPSIYSLNGVLTTNAALYVRGYPTFVYDNVSLIDPVKLEVAVTSGRLNALYVDGASTHVKTSDANGILAYSASASVIAAQGVRVLTTLENTSLTAGRGCEISSYRNKVGLVFTLKIAAADGEIDPGVDSTIRGYNAGQIIVASSSRAYSVTVMRVRAENVFEIISSTVNWVGKV